MPQNPPRDNGQLESTPDPSSPPEVLRCIAHDMRAPLSGALALLEMLERGTDGGLQPAQSARVRRVRDQLERLGKLATEISELAAIESGRVMMLPGPVQVAEVLAIVRQNLAPMLRARGMDLQVNVLEGLPRALADEGRLQQALAALIYGASRATSSTGLELTAAPMGGMIQIVLRETHRGMPVEAMGGDPAENRTGMALDAVAGLASRTGIAAARSLVAMQGGALAWRPDPSGDTVALLTLPAEQVMPGDSPRPPDRPRETTRRSS